MNMKEARKATRGLVTRVEKEVLYACLIWDNDKKKVVEVEILAENEKALLKDERKIIEFNPVETRQIMYAMPAEIFRANATKIIEIESEG